LCNRVLATPGMPLEIACFNVESALVAAKAGADRIEICTGASVGGTTPSLSDLQTIKERVNIPVNVMIRPRGGDFTYKDSELAQMEKDLQSFKLIADGFVFGVLQPDRSIDKERNQRLVALAAPKPCTFHRAFDVVPNPEAAAEHIVESGFSAILTSGGHPNALLGCDVIAEVVAKTRGKLDVIAGGGVRSENIDRIKEVTQAEWFHSSAVVDDTNIASGDEVRRLKRSIE